MERFGMELALELGDAGIPMMLYPMPILGATSRSPAGTAVVERPRSSLAVTAIQLSPRRADWCTPAAHCPSCARLVLRQRPEACCCALQGRWRVSGLPAGLGWGGTRPQPGAQYAENTLGLVLELMAARTFFGAGLLDSVRRCRSRLVIADRVPAWSRACCAA
jgi:hypothetical protein